jgi:nucleotide-binding universal stress UspA family protein
VLEDAPCTVAVAPAGYSTRPPVWREIGVAYDGTPGSEQALAVARGLARERAAKLSAFTAVPVPLRVHDAWNAQRELDEEAENARRRIAELDDVEGRAGSGDAAEELARYAASVDLLVIGSHKYRPIDRLMSGSTAQRVADGATSPLLVLAA